MFSGGIKLVLQRANDEKAVEQLSLMILAFVERGVAITGRLLSFAHKEDLRAVRLVPKDFLEGLCEILAHTPSIEIIVRTQVESGIPTILADKAQLETVILNLALNARDGMPDGGILTLSIALETIGNKSHRDALMAGSCVRLIVIGTGQSMDQKTLLRAGKPFFTTKSVGKGTGLGVAMARGFVQQSGGKFTLQSKLREGMTVTLWLPVANDQMETTETSNVSIAHLGLEGTTVMVIDDNTMVGEVLAQHLEYHGCVIRRASNGLKWPRCFGADERRNADQRSGDRLCDAGHERADFDRGMQAPSSKPSSRHADWICRYQPDLQNPEERGQRHSVAAQTGLRRRSARQNGASGRRTHQNVVPERLCHAKVF